MSIVREVATGVFWAFTSTVIVYSFFRIAAMGWSAGKKGQGVDVKLNINSGQDIFVIPARKGGVDE